MIKLFVSDLDGTLLNENHVLSDVNREAVLEMRKHGVSFMPASGRWYGDLQSAIKDLGISPKCICLNGAEFYDNDGTLLIDNPIDRELVDKVYELIKEYKVDADYYLEDGRYTNIAKEDLHDYLINRMKYLFYGEEVGDDMEAFLKTMDFEEQMHCEPDIQKILEGPVLKVELVMESIEMKQQILDKLNKIDGLITTSSHILNLEINSQDANKGHMIEQVCKNYGYDKDEVVVIGDGMNDITMLSRFKNSYAMGQATDEVKKVANFIAPPNSEDGVAQIIKQVLMAL